MKLFLGLGNPGRRYEHTRHNAGWWALDQLADVWRVDGWRGSGEARVASGTVDGVAVRLVKPLTYMNLSGAALRPYVRRPTWDTARDLLVIVDDVALPLGRVRLRARGSSGGHNGLHSIESVLQSREYARMRIGIGPAPERSSDDDLADFVLSRMSRAERSVLQELGPLVVAAAETWLKEGIEKAMNAFNRTREIEAHD